MAEEVTNTVKTSSDGMVKITLEKYQELLELAQAKPPVIHRTVHRTPEIQAKDNVQLGATVLLIGLGCVAAGALKLSTGLRQLKGLKN